MNIKTDSGIPPEQVGHFQILEVEDEAYVWVSIIASLRTSAGDSSVLYTEIDKSSEVETFKTLVSGAGSSRSRGENPEISVDSVELRSDEGDTTMEAIVDTDLEFVEKEGPGLL